MSYNHPTAALVPAQFRSPFSEEAVPPEVATALRQAAERIRRFADQQNKAILAIGRELADAKELLPSHLLGPWIRKEFGMADETASGYMAATREIPADPPSGKKSPRPKLISWDREGQNGARGYADIKLPCGVIIYHCPVFSGGQDGPYVQPSYPTHVDWPKAFYSDEFDDDIISEIREVDPRAFEKHPVRSESPTAFRLVGKGTARCREVARYGPEVKKCRIIMALGPLTPPNGAG